MRDAHAVAECHVRGRYVFELETQAGVRHVCKVTLRTLYQTGNRQLLRKAAVASPPRASG